MKYTHTIAYPERTCRHCHKPFIPVIYNAVVCDHCRPLYRAEQNRVALERRARRIGKRKRGSIVVCRDCGAEFAYKAGKHLTCSDCQRRKRVHTFRAWAAKFPEKIARYESAAHENYTFSGNRRAVLLRDGQTCRKCGATEHLHVHHIDGRGKGYKKAERNDTTENLLTLCGTCHRRLHVLTEKAMFAEHLPTVRRVLEEFLHQSSTCTPANSTEVSVPTVPSLNV